ncbi:hypothetical protein EDB85DRAFT_1898174 [Lactarius pseudohatsudake]|nr:hypothetical protein EDB85DRAFT_1898174 [Lactarius pseudohatsudake]
MRALPTKGVMSLITIKLKPWEDMQTPGSHTCNSNFLEVPSPLPPFILELDKKSEEMRYPVSEIESAYVQLIKSFLKDDYSKRFGIAPDDSTTSRAKLQEFVHYSTIFFGDQIINLVAFSHNKEPHVYSLLTYLASSAAEGDGMTFVFNKPWPFSLVLDVEGNNHRYTPRSDFSILIGNFPVLLVEVASASDGTDQFRMLLQAACLVRLGSTLVKSGSRYFHVKAIYINSHYIATEYTLYLVDDAPSSDMAMARVGYHQRIFNLTDRKDAFMFIFRIYNYLDSHFFRTHAEEVAAALWEVVGLATGSGNFAQATIHGYDCVYIEKSIAKATGNGKEVALKALNSAEEYILEYLRIAKADDHHVIKILDILPSKIAVMPWLEPVERLPVPRTKGPWWRAIAELQSWAAPEIGEVDGPTKTYSAILADRWSCGKVLEYIRAACSCESDSELDPSGSKQQAFTERGTQFVEI